MSVGDGYADYFGVPAAAAAALVSGVGALALTGSLGRVQRDETGWFAFALALVLFGGFLWVLGTLLRAAASARDQDASRDPNIAEKLLGLARRVLRPIGLTSLVAGLIIGFTITVLTASHTEQAAVTLQISPDFKSVSGTAKVNDLNSNKRLTVLVDGLVDNDPNPIPLYQAYVGPNSDGQAIDDVNVPIPSNGYDAIDIRAYTAATPTACGQVPLSAIGGEGTGCVIIRLPHPPMAPELTASLADPRPTSDVVKITLQATIAPIDKAALVQVVAVGQTGRVMLYRATSTTSMAGVMKRDISVPLPPHTNLVCVGAQFASVTADPAKLPCPVRQKSGMTTVELRVPDP